MNKSIRRSRIIFVVTFFMSFNVIGLKTYAEVRTIKIPEVCNNDSTISATQKDLQVGPTWVEKCEKICGAKDAGAVWYPTKVCSGTVISAVHCAPDESRPDCNRLIVRKFDPTNFDCAGNGGGEWSCKDRRVTVSCNQKVVVAGKAKEIPFKTYSTHAYCEYKTPHKD